MRFNINIPETNSLEINTFLKLLLKPGYLIRDYLSGRREGILPPVTAVLLFFSFYVLISDAFSYNRRNHAIGNDDIEVGPVTFVTNKDSEISLGEDAAAQDTVALSSGQDIQDEAVQQSEEPRNTIKYKKEENMLANLGMFNFVDKVWTWFTLYEHPENIDSEMKQFVATAESWIRGQGVFSFLTDFLLFFPALCILLRKSFTIKQNAVVTAYILCQRCIFKIGSVLVTLGRSDSLGLLLGTVLLAFVFHQLLDIGWKQSLRKAILYWMVTIVVMIVLISPFAVGLLLYFKPML